MADIFFTVIFRQYLAYNAPSYFLYYTNDELTVDGEKYDHLAGGRGNSFCRSRYYDHWYYCLLLVRSPVAPCIHLGHEQFPIYVHIDVRKFLHTTPFELIENWFTFIYKKYNNNTTGILHWGDYFEKSFNSNRTACRGMLVPGIAILWSSTATTTFSADEDPRGRT